ncbi:MAG: pyridoxal phosphate-dependent aminotransferase [Candidatus Paceibacterota bacterium]
MPTVSKRITDLKTENAFVVGVETAAYEKETGKKVMKFYIGQPDFPTPENIQLANIKATTGGKHGYTPSAGIPELREAVAKYLSKTRGIQYFSDDIAVAGGAKPFIGYAIQCVTEYGKGHEILCPNPGFPIYESFSYLTGATPVPLMLYEKNNFNFDIDDLGRKINKNTRLVVINSPHNPTGSVLSKEELKAIAEIVKKWPEAWTFSDEVYSRITNGNEFHSIASEPGMQDRTIVLEGASKTYAMTGWRIGYAANKRLAKHFGTLITNTDSCANHMAQWATVEALNGSQEVPEKMARIFHERRDVIVALLNAIPGVTCLLPGGAFYAYPNVTEACKIVGAANSEEFRKKLLREAFVSVTADTHFGPQVPNDGQHVRFSFAASMEDIIEGMYRMKAWIKSYQK